MDHNPCLEEEQEAIVGHCAPWCYGSWYSCLGKNRDCMYDEQCRADSDPCSGRSCDECEIGGCDHGTM